MHFQKIQQAGSQDFWSKQAPKTWRISDTLSVGMSQFSKLGNPKKQIPWLFSKSGKNCMWTTKNYFQPIISLQKFMGKLMDLFARPRAFKLCTIHPRWTRGRFLGTTESAWWHTEIFGDFLPVTWYLQMNLWYLYDRVDVFYYGSPNFLHVWF